MKEKLNPRHTSQEERAAAIKALWQTASKNILNSELYPTELWNLIQAYAEEKLKQCRPEFDVNHTHGVVYWAYELAKLYNNKIEEQQSANDEAIDLLVLISAAWLHDIGYFGQFTEVADYTAVQKKKADHMEDGALMAKEFLSTRATKFLSDDQINEIVDLILVHDELEKKHPIIGQILMAADTLGMIDVTKVEPTFHGQDALGFFTMDKTIRRIELYQDIFGSLFLPELMQMFEQFVIDRDFDGTDPR